MFDVAPELLTIFSSPDAWGPLLGLGLLVVALVGFGWWRRGRTAALIEPPASAAPAAHREPDRWRSALARTRERLGQRLDELLGRPTLDPATLEALEEQLLLADVGLNTSRLVLDGLSRRVREGSVAAGAAREALRTELMGLLSPVHRPLRPPDDGLWVILVVGVNGSGKTTTIGKLATRLREQGRNVLLAAGDTYRAAAGEQLAIWAERAGAEIVRHQEGADPGAVAYDAINAARARGFDVVLVDTAGRLQTLKPLMDQLAKVRRVINKALPGAPQDTLLVVDGTMGQNALSQAKLFHEATPLTGVVVTKLDGTAKGGMVLSIAAELRLPVQLVGLGEQAKDLQDFDPVAFTNALV